jgi:hypothetical protein
MPAYLRLCRPGGRIAGRDHPDTLTTRNNVAYLTGAAGDAAGALRLFREVLAGQRAGSWPRPSHHANHAR